MKGAVYVGVAHDVDGVISYGMAHRRWTLIVVPHRACCSLGWAADVLWFAPDALRRLSLALIPGAYLPR